MINHSRCIYRRRETRSSHVRDYTGLVLRSFSSLSSRLALVCVSACRVKSLPSACVVRSGRGFNYIVLSTPSLSSFSCSRLSTRRSSRWWGRRVLQALACACRLSGLATGTDRSAATLHGVVVLRVLCVILFSRTG